MPAEIYTVRVTKDYLVFSAGHFITFNGGQCERLHGHNYRVAVELDGLLDANGYVFDFIALRDATRAITDELDHRVLLPTESQLIRVDWHGNFVRARFEDREWQFPRGDCLLLPIANTTAELLARWIGQRLLEQLGVKHQFTPSALRIEVEECFGQSGIWHWRKES